MVSTDLPLSVKLCCFSPNLLNFAQFPFDLWSFAWSFGVSSTNLVSYLLLNSCRLFLILPTQAPFISTISLLFELDFARYLLVYLQRILSNLSILLIRYLLAVSVLQSDLMSNFSAMSVYFEPKFVKTVAIWSELKSDLS